MQGGCIQILTCHDGGSDLKARVNLQHYLIYDVIWLLLDLDAQYLYHYYDPSLLHAMFSFTI